MATPRLWLERFLERRRMARDAESFTDEMLRDFGLSRREARAIARTPFWRAIDEARARPADCHGASPRATQSDSLPCINAVD